MYPDGLGPNLYAGDHIVCDRTSRRVLLRVTYLLVQSLLPCGHSTIGLFEITTLLTTVYLRWPCHLPDRPTTGAGSHKPTSRLACAFMEGDLVPRASHRRIAPAACLGRVRGQNPRSSPRANLLSLSLDSYIRDIVSHPRFFNKSLSPVGRKTESARSERVDWRRKAADTPIRRALSW